MKELKTLFIQSEINKIDIRISEYEELYTSNEIKDLSLRRLIAIKQREKELLNDILRGRNG